MGVLDIHIQPSTETTLEDNVFVRDCAVQDDADSGCYQKDYDNTVFTSLSSLTPWRADPPLLYL